MKAYLGTFALASTMLWSVAAVAVPPKKTEAEMMNLADLVVDAKAVTIVCDGAPVVTAQKTETFYLSTLLPSKSYKGGTPKSFQIRGKTVVWTPGPGPAGGWFQDPVAKGWVGKLYLKKETDGTYSEVWWNGMTEDTTKSKPETLPVCSASDGGVDAAKLDAAVVSQDAAIPPDSVFLPDGAIVDAVVSPDGAIVDGVVRQDSGIVDGEAPNPDSALPKDMYHPEGDPLLELGPADEASVPTVDKGATGQDAGSASTSDDDGSCAVAGGDAQHAAPVWIVLMLLGLVVLRRRRV